jgi:hypothetical protein
MVGIITKADKQDSQRYEIPSYISASSISPSMCQNYIPARICCECKVPRHFSQRRGCFGNIKNDSRKIERNSLDNKNCTPGMKFTGEKLEKAFT